MSAPNAEPETVTIDGVTVEREALDRIAHSLREYWTKKLRREYKLKQIPEVPHQSSGPADGMPRASEPGNPVLAKVERMDALAQEATEIKTWLDAVDMVRAGLDDEQGAIIDNAYLLPPKQRKGKDDVCKALSIGRPRYYRVLAKAHLAYLLVMGDPAENDTDKQDTERIQS